MKANKILTALVFTTLITGVPALALTHAKRTQVKENQKRKAKQTERREEREEREERDEANEQGGEAEENQATLRREVKISLEQARATALNRASGKIEKEELERENGKLVYSFDIRNAGGTITEVQVSAIDNKVVSVEKETAEQEAAEKKKEERERHQQRRNQRKP